MIGSKKYVKFEGTCSMCGMKFDKPEEAQQHESLFGLQHIIKSQQSFDLSSYISDLIGMCKPGIRKLK